MGYEWAETQDAPLKYENGAGSLLPNYTVKKNKFLR